MTCEEARILIGGDPENAAPELLEHLETCAECRAYRQQILGINTRIRRALELDWERLPKAAPSGTPTVAGTPSPAAGTPPAPASTPPGTASAAATSAEPARAPAAPPDAARTFATGTTATGAARTSAATSTPTATTAVATPPAATPPATTAVATTTAATVATPSAGAPASAEPARTQTQAVTPPAVTPPAAATPAAEAANITPLRPRSRPAVPKQQRPRLMAFAASVAAGLVAALVLWLSRPPESLADEIVKHVEGEPNSWSRTAPVTGDRLKAVLRKSRVTLGSGMEAIVYASSCWFRGHFVPHFVVMTQDGPVTVMILVNEKISAQQPFNEDGFSGLLVPAPTGSVAVLSRTPMALDQAASNVVKALQATGDQGSTSTALPSRL